MRKNLLLFRVFNSFKMDFFKRFTRGEYNKNLVAENREKSLSMTIEEKRKLYKCKQNYITIDKIKTWPEYYKENNLAEKGIYIY